MLPILSRRFAAAFMLIVALLLAAAPVPGAPGAPGADDPATPKATPSLPKAEQPKEVELETEVDLVKLLRSSMVFPVADQLTDSIWQITPNEGRTIVRIPLTVSRPDSEVIVSGAAVKVRGGRFICWQLIDPSEEITGKATPLAAGQPIRATGDGVLPAGVPRIARSVRLDPGGKIHWKMERVIPGAKVVETTPGAYNMRLNPSLTESVNPGNPPRILKNAGESIPDFNKRKQTAEAEYRVKAAQYRELRQVLTKLPDEFSGPLPTTLWAVYEARSNAKTIELDGPAPLPWDFPFDLLQSLQHVMAATATSQPPATAGITISSNPVEQELLKVLAGEKVHPYTIRLIAHAITLSPFLSTMEEGDAKFQVAAKILEAKDSTATGELMKYLAVRPGKASASLMQKALQAGLLDAKAQLGSVLGMITTLGADSSASPDSAIQIINRYLADANGPAVEQILTPLFKLAREKPALADPVAKGLRIDATGARRDEIIIALLTAAVADPVAMNAVDGRLLGSEDPALVERTLYLISRAARPQVDLTFTTPDGKAIELAPAAGVTPKVVVLAFWSTAMPQPTETLARLSQLADAYGPQGVRIIGINLDNDKARFENFVKESKNTLPMAWDEKGFNGELSRRFAVMQAPQLIAANAQGQILWRGRIAQLDGALSEALKPVRPAATVTDKDPRPLLLDDVGILNNDHAIFRLLGSAKFRNMAWGALRQMKMAPPGIPGTPAAPSADRDKWTANLVDLAITQSPTPVAAVAFLAKHDEPGVAQSLMQLVMRADADASRDASRALLGSGWPLDQLLTGQTDRHAFGLRFYENIQNEAPYSVHLLRDKADAASATGWFARQISAGSLPHPVEWLQPYSGEDRLLLLVNASDEQLALGAIGTLVAGAGGAGHDTDEIAAKLRGNKNATIPEITRLWNILRKELFAAKLKKASTQYTLSIRTGVADRAQEVKWEPPRTAGKVAMKIEGASVKMNEATAAIPADETLSIVMPAADLPLLDKTPAAGLNAMKVAGDRPIAFTPRGNDGWVAHFPLPDGRRAELILIAAP